MNSAEVVCRTVVSYLSSRWQTITSYSVLHFFVSVSFISALMLIILFLLLAFGEGNGTPLQCSCLENPMDGGAW